MTRYWSKLMLLAALPMAETADICLVGSGFAPDSGQPEHIRRQSSKDIGNPEEGPQAV